MERFLFSAIIGRCIDDVIFRLIVFEKLADFGIFCHYCASFVESLAGPEEAGFILLAKSVASCESDMTEWFESSPMALTGVSDLKKK